METTPGFVQITGIREDLCPALARLHQDCYTACPSEALNEEDFRALFRRYPEGNFVATINGEIVGAASGLLVDFDLRRPEHRFADMAGSERFSGHKPDGDFYYGVGIAVHPRARGRRVGRELYLARKRLVKMCNKRGIVGGSLLLGYPAFHRHLTPWQYIQKVVSGEIFDPALTFHLRNGFRACSALSDYIDAPFPDNCAALLYWGNSLYRGLPQIRHDARPLV